MLILTRRIGESIVIGKEITVTVLGDRSGQIRLGITAPDSVPVHREEIFRKIKDRSDATSSETSEDTPA